MQNSKQAIILARTKNVTSLTCPSPEPWALTPDDLRDQVRITFATLCEPERQQLRQRLLKGLAQAGVHLGSALFKLGIPATTFDDLSPSDLGKLMRYVRIYCPAAREALVDLLGELLAWKDNLTRTARTVNQAA